MEIEGISLEQIPQKCLDGNFWERNLFGFHVCCCLERPSLSECNFLWFSQKVEMDLANYEKNLRGPRKVHINLYQPFGVIIFYKNYCANFHFFTLRVACSWGFTKNVDNQMFFPLLYSSMKIWRWEEVRNNSSTLFFLFRYNTFSK